MFTSRRSLLTLVVLLLANVVAAQPPVDDKTFDQEPFVIEHLASKYTFHADGTGTREVELRARIQSQAGVQAFGIIPAPYEKGAEEVTIDYIRVRKADGAVVVTPPEDVQDIDTDVSRIAPMYSDERLKHAAVKGLMPGDTLEYRMSAKVLKPTVPGQFWTQHDFYRAGIVLDETVEVDVPGDVYVNVKSTEVQPTVTTENGLKLYRWKTSNLRHKTPEEKAKESKNQQSTPAIQVTTYRSWEDIGKWFGALERERVQPTAAIEAKAAALTKDAKTDVDKLRAIYTYVAQDFRYIGLEFGVGRYQPHSADDVLKNGYGDCKDKHTLLAALSQAAGLHVSPVLINARRTVDEEVPSPAQFDHVISLAEVDGKTIWLDTTPQMSPFGMLLYPLRDKRALVVSERPEWKKTPESTPMESYLSFDAEGKVSPEGVLRAKIRRELRGDTEVFLRLGFASTGKSEWQELAQRFSQISGFSGAVSDVDVSPPSKTDEPFRLSYTYERKDVPQWAEYKRMTAFLPPVPIYRVDEIDQSNDPIELEGPYRLTYHAKMQFPTGYKPDLLSSVDLHSDYADYRAHYEFKDGYVVAERELKVKVREIPASRRAEYNKFATAVSDDENSYIVMKSGSETSTFPAIAEAAGTPGLNLRDLYEEGRTKFALQDFQGAVEVFERIKNVDPKFYGVWTAIGACRLRQNQPDEALKALRMEITIYPKDEPANVALVQALVSLKRTDEALDVLREYVKLVPQSVSANLSLARSLVQKARYDEAASVLETAVKANPTNSALVRQLGFTYSKVGNADKAIATMHVAVELSPEDTTALNDAAYYLADANMALDQAEAWSLQAVKVECAKTERMNVGTLTDEDLRRVSRLASFWDTLGWIYFRRGDLDKAQPYLHAAWTLAQSQIIGRHLAELYEKQGKKMLAATVYAQTMRPGPPRPGSPSLQWSPQERKKVEALVGATTAASLINKAGEDLSKSRTIRIPNFAHAAGSGTAFLIFGPDRKVTARFTAGPAEMRRQTSAFQASVAMKGAAEIPGELPVQVVRRAYVMCSGAEGNCDVVLLTPDMVTSVN